MTPVSGNQAFRDSNWPRAETLRGKVVYASHLIPSFPEVADELGSIQFARRVADPDIKHFPLA